jgi:hypothetical protein
MPIKHYFRKIGRTNSMWRVELHKLYLESTCMLTLVQLTFIIKDGVKA